MGSLPKEAIFFPGRRGETWNATRVRGVGMMETLPNKKRSEEGTAVILNAEFAFIRPQLEVFFRRLFFFYGVEAGRFKAIMLVEDNGALKFSYNLEGGICIPLTYGP